MITGGMYSATDKALYDALNQHQVTNQELRNFFFMRGIIVSKDSSRRYLAKTFSRFIHDYDDHQKLASILGVSSRRDRTTSTVIDKGDVTIDNFEVAAHALKDKLEGDGEVVTISRNNDIIRVNVKYTDYDFNRSEFKQVVEREASFIVEKENTAITIRGPLNDKALFVNNYMIENVEEDLNISLPREEVSLSHIEDANKRTEFFFNLIKNMDEFKLVDVTDVYVFHPRVEDDDTEDDSTPVSNTVHISRASLKGVGVQQSDELKSLASRDFYIWKIIWVAELVNSPDSDQYVFEAQFSNPDDCTQFSYLARGFFKYIELGEYNKSKIQHSDLEEQRLNRIIEKAALKTLKSL